MTQSRLAALEEFLKQEPNDSFTHYAIALEHASLKNFPAAIAKLEELIARDPAYVPSYQMLGNLYIQLDRENDAVHTLERGIQAAGRAGDMHAQREMQDALDDLED